MLKTILKSVFGGIEESSAAVFDGVLRPNQELDLCPLLARDLEDASDVVILDGHPVVSVGHRLIRISGHWFAPSRAVVATFDAACGALCNVAGGVAVALDGQRIVIRGGTYDGTEITEAAGRAFSCVTAMVSDGNRLVVAEGSMVHSLNAWRRDLMEAGRSGRVVEIDLATGKSTLVAQDLAWAGGVALTPKGGVLVSESWLHRVRQIDGTGHDLENLPAYPGRLVARHGGGYWLSCFAARTQLVDFILADRALCSRMMAELPEPYWVAPTLATTDHPFVPVQMGGIKQFGAVKPWAPARSYGLVVRLDADLEPIASLHSRVDAKRHGVTGIAATDGGAVILSGGHGKLMSHEENAV